MATILLVGVDLFFRGKLDALLPAHRLVTSDSVHPPDLVVCDIARVDLRVADEVVVRLTDDGILKLDATLRDRARLATRANGSNA